MVNAKIVSAVFLCNSYGISICRDYHQHCGLARNHWSTGAGTCPKGYVHSDTYPALDSADRLNYVSWRGTSQTNTWLGTTNELQVQFGSNLVFTQGHANHEQLVMFGIYPEALRYVSANYFQGDGHGVCIWTGCDTRFDASQQQYTGGIQPCAVNSYVNKHISEQIYRPDTRTNYGECRSCETSQTNKRSVRASYMETCEVLSGDEIYYDGGIYQCDYELNGINTQALVPDIHGTSCILCPSGSAIDKSNNPHVCQPCADNGEIDVSTMQCKVWNGVQLACDANNHEFFHVSSHDRLVADVFTAGKGCKTCTFLPNQMVQQSAVYESDTGDFDSCTSCSDQDIIDGTRTCIPVGDSVYTSDSNTVIWTACLHDIDRYKNECLADCRHKRFVDDVCVFCPSGQVGDGVETCMPCYKGMICPQDTTPVLCHPRDETGTITTAMPPNGNSPFIRPTDVKIRALADTWPYWDYTWRIPDETRTTCMPCPKGVTCVIWTQKFVMSSAGDEFQRYDPNSPAGHIFPFFDTQLGRNAYWDRDAFGDYLNDRPHRHYPHTAHHGGTELVFATGKNSYAADGSIALGENPFVVCPRYQRAVLLETSPVANVECRPCPSYTYWDNYRCIATNPNTYVDRIQSSETYQQVFPCPYGSHSPGGAAFVNTLVSPPITLLDCSTKTDCCTPCAAGTGDIHHMNTCESAIVGTTWTPDSGADQFNQCTTPTAGQYITHPCNTTHDTVVEMCTANHFCLNGIKSSCTSCPAGYEQQPPPTNTSLPNASACNSHQNTICSQCATGSYSNSTLNTCILCPAGSFTNLQQTDCSPCPTNHICDGVQPPQRCRNGMLQSTFRCKCDTGYYNTGVQHSADNACTPCPRGYKCPRDIT
jgi:hypothetical protein